MVYLFHNISMRAEITEKLMVALDGESSNKIVYNRFDGELSIDSETYGIEDQSFNEIGKLVLGTLKEIYGDYRTIPYTFNSEAYENESFKAEVLALGGAGLLEFTVYKKR